MDKDRLNFLLEDCNNKEREKRLKKESLQERQKECERKHQQIVGSFRRFMRSTAPGETAEVKRAQEAKYRRYIVLAKDKKVPELGRGTILATVTSCNMENETERSVSSAHNAHDFETAEDFVLNFTFVTEKEKGGQSWESLGDDEVYNSLNLRRLLQVQPTQDSVIKVESWLQVIAPKIDSSLELLIECAGNPELNPEIADQVRRAYAE